MRRVEPFTPSKVAHHCRRHPDAFLGNLSFLAEHRGEYEEALRLSREAVRLGWSFGRRMMAGWKLAQVAGAELGLGRPGLSARLFGAADHALSLAGVDRHPCDVPELGAPERIDVRRPRRHHADRHGSHRHRGRGRVPPGIRGRSARCLALRSISSRRALAMSGAISDMVDLHLFVVHRQLAGVLVRPRWASHLPVPVPAL